MGAFSHDKCDDKVRGIQRFHMDSKGWSDIAYSALVCPHGFVFAGRGPKVRTAANGTNYGNANYVAVCYLGGEGDPLTEAGKRGMNEAIAWLGGGEVRTHASFKATACPGPALKAWVAVGRPAGPVPEPQEENLMLTFYRPKGRTELFLLCGNHLEHVPSMSQLAELVHGNRYREIEVPLAEMGPWRVWTYDAKPTTVADYLSP